MLTKEEMMYKIIGLESEISEIVNVLYPKLDNNDKEWIKLNFRMYLKDDRQETL